MATYSANLEDWQGEPVVTLRDHTNGAVAKIAPALGSNCVFWAIQHDGQELQIIETPDAPQVLHERATRAGTPILFPFPGRVRNAQYQFEGHTYTLPPNDKGGVHHIHGVAVAAAWQTVDFGDDANGAYVVTQLIPENLSPELRAGYPFDFALSLRFSLQAQTLTCDITLENHEAKQTLPFGFGLHPYFRVPLIPTTQATDRSQCPVQIAATTHWPTVDGLPTAPAQPSQTPKDFQTWRLLGTDHFDDMYSSVIFENDYTKAGYRSPGTGLSVNVLADYSFHDWVLFTPQNRPSLAIEPYTCPPNAINMPQEGVISDSNLLKLAAGEIWQAKILFEVISF